jgi:hypothetical protein
LASSRRRGWSWSGSSVAKAKDEGGAKGRVLMVSIICVFMAQGP